MNTIKNNNLIFKTKAGNKYIFDNSTGIIIPISKNVDYLIKNYNIYSKEYLFSIMSRKFGYTKESFEKKYNYISNMKKYGFFHAGGNFFKKNISKSEYLNFLETASASQLVIILTNNCNMNCKYCIFSDMYPYTSNINDEVISFETAKRAVDYFLILHKKRISRGYKKKPMITFYGGEPLLEVEVIKKITEYCLNIGINADFYLTTNGILLNSSVIDFFIKNKFRIMISLDGEEKNHDRNRVFKNGTGTFDLIMKNIEYYFKAIERIDPTYPPLSFSCCYDNYTSMIDTVNFFRNNSTFKDKRYYVYFSEISPYSTKYYEYCDEQKKLDYIRTEKYTCKESLEILREEFFQKKIVGNSDFLLNSLFSIFPIIKNRAIGKQHVLSNCCVPGAKLTVSPDEKFYICEKMNRRYPIGSVSEGILWEKVDHLLKNFFLIQEENCNYCNLSRLCPMCFMHLSYNSEMKFNKEFCENMKNNIPKILSELYSILEKNNTAFNNLEVNIIDI